MLVGHVFFLGRVAACVVFIGVATFAEKRGCGWYARGGEQTLLEVLEGDHDNGHVVEGLPHQSVLEDGLDAEAAVLMHRDTRAGGASLLLGGLASHPDCFADILVAQLVVDAI